ncbi:WD40 repeat-like protein [Peniophora sp. CONT]|nr:WD40 repeat-like protein [Peniophora sp. CONT]
MDNNSRTVPPEACSCGDGRNLVICIDGTSNDYGEKITNVLKLYRLVDKKAEGTDEMHHQHAYYHSGIGTYKRSLRGSLVHYAKAFGRPIDLAVALSFENTILDAYRWLSDVYKKGDRIFLFGFSRGAYQVRTLSAMIAKVGLIHRNNEWQIPLAYQLYANADDSSRATTSTHSFKDVFSRDVKVHFVGAWDTVSSVGIRRGELLPKTIDGMIHVCYFRHALALDERRVKFLPEYARGGKSPGQSEKVAWQDFTDTQEVWFAGTHSDVGGKTQNEDRPALDWMLAQAQAAGLRFQFSKELRSGPNVYEDRPIKVNKSLKEWYWRLPEYLPLRRVTYKMEKGGNNTTHRPHCGKGRVILAGQKIHPSVWMSDHLGTDQYIPCARLILDKPNRKWSDTEFWEDLRGENYAKGDGTLHEWKEVYLPELMKDLVMRYIGGESRGANPTEQKNLLCNMAAYAGSTAGWQALGRQVLFLIQRSEPVPVADLCDILDVLVTQSKNPPTPVGTYKTVRSDILRHLTPAATKDSPEYYQRARKCIAKLTDTVQVLQGHSGVITSVAVSLDNNQVVSGSSDGAIRLWDNTDKVWDAGSSRTLKSFKGHSGPVSSVAFYSEQGRTSRSRQSSSRATTRGLIASCSEDKTVRLWDVEMENPLHSLEGHDRPVRSVAFSRDGKRIVSGSEDGTVRVWDVMKGDEVHVFKEDEDSVFSVAFSRDRDGERIVSGSENGTVRIWDVEARTRLQSFKAHTRTVRCVAFSTDGKRVISGSVDKTVKIWDVEGTGQKALKVFMGHTRPIRSAAFSLDGKRAISGSNDGKVWIWDAETQIQTELKVASEWETTSPLGRSFEGAVSYLASTLESPATLESHGTPEIETMLKTEAMPEAEVKLENQVTTDAEPEVVEAVGQPALTGSISVQCVAFSQDCTRVISGSEDKCVRIWNILEDPV